MGEHIGDFKENVIEFYKDSETATVSFSQGRYISRIRQLKEKYPDQIEIVAENKDGSVTAHIPVNAIHIQIYEGRENNAGVKAMQEWRKKQEGES